MNKEGWYSPGAQTELPSRKAPRYRFHRCTRTLFQFSISLMRKFRISYFGILTGCQSPSSLSFLSWFLKSVVSNPKTAITRKTLKPCNPAGGEHGQQRSVEPTKSQRVSRGTVLTGAPRKGKHDKKNNDSSWPVKKMQLVWGKDSTYGYFGFFFCK